MGPLCSLSINTTKGLSYNIKIQFKGEEMVGFRERKGRYCTFIPFLDTQQWALQSRETSIGFHRHSDQFHTLRFNTVSLISVTVYIYKYVFAIVWLTVEGEQNPFKATFHSFISWKSPSPSYRLRDDSGHDRVTIKEISNPINKSNLYKIKCHVNYFSWFESFCDVHYFTS